MNRRYLFPIIFLVIILLDIFDDVFVLGSGGLPLWIGVVLLFPVISYFSRQESNQRKARKLENIERTTRTDTTTKAMEKDTLADEFAIDPEDYKY
ncbi:MAG: hypothetical protein EA374_02265 [Acholeplasmatales bacterium]|nr:MAG: hypothetical protein EA374_02265 [Acholeplasmatales bacterium]